MALQTINVGNFANDGTGDDLRTAFQKVNQNFEEVDLIGGQNNTISNIGDGVGLYKEKIGVDLRLKTLKAGTNVTLVASPTTVTINSNYFAFTSISTDTGNITADVQNESINILGGTGISTSVSGNNIIIEGTDYSFSDDTNPTLGGNLNLNGFDIVGDPGTNITAGTFTGNILGNVSGNVFGNLVGNVVGNLTGLVHGIDVRELSNELNTFDFGRFIHQPNSLLDWIATEYSFDFGSINGPAIYNVDMGTII